MNEHNINHYRTPKGVNKNTFQQLYYNALVICKVQRMLMTIHLCIISINYYCYYYFYYYYHC
jgi:hypothetical protein